jgi:hypothetical protein
MREMRHIASLFNQSIDFDEQWILLKSYLNTAHSMSDNDKKVKNDFFSNELMNFVLVLRNVLHHQPAKWHFGKHDVYPTRVNLKITQHQQNVAVNLSLVIQKSTLQETKLQITLRLNSPKQLEILNMSLEKISGHIVVSNLIEEIQLYVEDYCKRNNHYTEAYDIEPLGYNLIENIQ